MRLEIKTRDSNKDIKITDLNKVRHNYNEFVLKEEWYKLTIPGTRNNVVDILVNNESIRHYLNAGSIIDDTYQIWIHGNLAEMFARISGCIAQDDLLRFKMLGQKYLICESWNEPVQGEFIPNSVRQFFANGEGPFWYHLDNWYKLPYIQYDGETVSTNISMEEDLLHRDIKFNGQGKCISLKNRPTLPTIHVDNIKNKDLRNVMKTFGFTEILQMQQITLEPNSVLPVHRDDFLYSDGRHIIGGPTQLYFVLSGDKQDIKFKFKNVGLIDVDKPIFINNQDFVHSLVYTGDEPRTVLLAYGVSSFTNKRFL